MYCIVYIVCMVLAFVYVYLASVVKWTDLEIVQKICAS